MPYVSNKNGSNFYSNKLAHCLKKQIILKIGSDDLIYFQEIISIWSRLISWLWFAIFSGKLFDHPA